MQHPLIHINTTLTLYRSDTTRPPSDWSKEFKCYRYDGVGEKNKAGLFFLSDSIDIANSLGKINCKNLNQNSYYLTESQAKDIHIIDFSYCSTLMQMIRALALIGINVFTNDFKTYEEGKGQEHTKTFGKFRVIYDDYIQGKNATEVYTQLSDVGYDADPVGTFGQRITDFDNGISFINLIKKWGAEVDGYRWRECNDPRGLTYCLFSTGKILKPSCTEIKTNI